MNDLFINITTIILILAVTCSVIGIIGSSSYENKQPTCYVIDNNIYEEGVVIDDVCLVRKGFAGSDTTRYINYSMKEGLE